MDACELIQTERFQTKQKQSGVSPANLAAVMLKFDEKYGKEPELDQIPGANSTNYVIEQLNIKDNSVDNKTLLKYTNSDTVEEAQIKLNNQFRDLNIKILDCGQTSIIEINRRPSQYLQKESSPIDVEQNLTREQEITAVISLLDKLKKQYGIDIHYLSQDELNNQFESIVPDLNLVNGFVYQGQIYINTDIAKVSSPVHELLHIFLGGMRFQDPVLYEKLINSIEDLKNYETLAKPFIGKRTKLDINEEIFIDQFSKYLTNQFSFIKNMSDSTLDQIFYNINRLLDSTLNGNYSVESVDPQELYNMNLLELSQLVQSNTFVPSYRGSLDQATVHRLAANIKQSLLENGDLMEICE